MINKLNNNNKCLLKNLNQLKIIINKPNNK